MSQPIAIVHKIERGFNEFGQVSESTESYIKVSTDIRKGLLAFLSGSQFKVFMCIAAHEADEEPGASLSDIIRETGVKAKQTIIDALEFLSNPDHQFIRQDGKEKDGTYRWRVCAFAWYGSDPNRGGKKTLPPQKNIFCSSSSRFNQDDSIIETTTTSTPAVEKILRAANVRTNELDLSAMTVERANAIAAYIASNPEGKRSPAAWAYTMLLSNPGWEPPKPKQSKWYGDEYSEFVNR